MWILSAMQSTSSWEPAPAGFLVQIDKGFVQALNAIGDAVRSAASEHRVRVSHVEVSLVANLYYILDRDTHKRQVADLLGIDGGGDDGDNGAYCVFEECPLFFDSIVEVEGDDTFNARIDGGVLSFVSLSGDPQLSTPEIHLSELEEYR